MTEAQGNFATALAEFGCGSDEDSLIMGTGPAAAARSDRWWPRLHLVAALVSQECACCKVLLRALPA